MCRIQQCFCCLNLRVGSYMSAVYTLILGLLNLIVISIAVDTLRRFKEQQKSAGKDEGLTAVNIILIVTLVIYALWLLSSILLIIGINKRLRGMMIPWMIMTIILTIFAGIAIILGLIAFGVTFSSGIRAFTFVLQVAIFIFNVYALICIFSYYKDDCQEIGTSRSVKGVV